jgi:hypothetical protein
MLNLEEGLASLSSFWIYWQAKHSWRRVLMRDGDKRSAECAMKLTRIIATGPQSSAAISTQSQCGPLPLGQFWRISILPLGWSWSLVFAQEHPPTPSRGASLLRKYMDLIHFKDGQKTGRSEISEYPGILLPSLTRGICSSKPMLSASRAFLPTPSQRFLKATRAQCLCFTSTATPMDLRLTSSVICTAEFRSAPLLFLMKYWETWDWRMSSWPCQISSRIIRLVLSGLAEGDTAGRQM